MLPLIYCAASRVLSPGTMRLVGRITKPESCVVTEERNKDYTVASTINPTDELVDVIEDQMFLVCKPNPFDDPQFFEIQGSNYDGIGRLQISGKHIKHCAFNNLIIPDYTSTGGRGTPSEHWEFVKGSFVLRNNFNFVSDIQNSGYIETGYNKADTLGRFFEEMAAEYSGEYHYDNFNVNLCAARGSHKNYVLRWDKNISNPQLSLSTADIKSHVVAYGTVHVNVGSGYDIQMCSDPYLINGQNSKLNKIFMLDASERMTVKEIGDPQISGEYERAKADLNRIASNYRGEVSGQESVNLRVDYRPRLDEMKEVGLCDTVDVLLKSGRTVTAKITKTEFDSLRERWNAIELGKAKLNLTSYISRRRK